MLKLCRVIELAVRRSMGCRSEALSLLCCLSMSTLGVCALPIAPGCHPGESLPQGDQLLGVVLVADRLASSVLIDRDGRSMFSPGFTVWMLSTPGACRTIPEDDLFALQSAWESVDPDLFGGDPRETRKPFLRIVYVADGAPRKLSVSPDGVGTTPDLERAVALTLAVLHRTYGDRFLRELRSAGLEGLLGEPP
jgi:hypothetical protein